MCVYENLLQFGFLFFFVRGEGDCFVRPISVFYNIIAILIDLFCCLNYTFLFYQFKEYIICIEISPTGIHVFKFCKFKIKCKSFYLILRHLKKKKCNLLEKLQ